MKCALTGSVIDTLIVNCRPTDKSADQQMNDGAVSFGSIVGSGGIMLH